MSKTIVVLRNPAR